MRRGTALFSHVVSTALESVPDLTDVLIENRDPYQVKVAKPSLELKEPEEISARAGDRAQARDTTQGPSERITR